MKVAIEISAFYMAALKMYIAVGIRLTGFTVNKTITNTRDTVER